VTLWRQYGVAFRLALLDHYLATYPSQKAAAHALGMDRTDMLRARRRLVAQAQRHQPPIRMGLGP
jgi:hypothetical protein